MQGEPVEVNCDFCGSHYLFDTEDLKADAEIRNEGENGQKV